MTIPSNDLKTIHPSAYSHAAGLLLWADAAPRSHDTLRFRCPETGIFVCITDDSTLDTLAWPRAPLRCPACRRVHLVTTQDGNAAAMDIVAASAAP